MNPTLFIITYFASIVFASDASTGLPRFERVPLTEPLNWIAGRSLFPGRVIAGYHAEVSDYDATSWAEKVLGDCKNYTACTSSLSYQGT